MSVSITTHNPNNSGKTPIELSSADRQFVENLDNRLTMFGELPYTVPERMIIQQIKQAALLFYRTYFNAVQKVYFFIDNSDLKKFSEDYFSKVFIEGFRGYMVNLHPSIRVVKDIWETNKEREFGVNELIENLQYGVNPAYYGQSLLGINQNLYITEAACKMVEQATISTVFSESIPFDFNPLSHQLMIGKELKRSIVLECERDVPIQNLYNDDLFDRYVYGLCKRELKRMIGSHTIQLPGDTTLNVDEICNNLDDIERVEDILKGGSGLGDVIMMKA